MTADDLFSKLNPVVRLWLRAPLLHWVLSRGLLLLHVVGRRSGKRYSIPVGYRRVDGGAAVVVAVSEARGKQWWRNYQEPTPVELHLRGRGRSGVARRIDPSEPAFRTQAEETLRGVPGMARVFHLEGWDRTRGLGAAQLEHLATEIALVRIDLDA